MNTKSFIRIENILIQMGNKEVCQAVVHDIIDRLEKAI